MLHKIESATPRKKSEIKCGTCTDTRTDKNP